jgi:predicted nucleotide-binding protein
MVNELTIFLAAPKRRQTAKLFAILADLGGAGSIDQIVAHGEKHGAGKIRTWRPATLLGSAKARVVNAQGVWHLLPAAYEQLISEGFRRAVSAEGTPEASDMKSKPTIFVGHGHSLLWRELKDFLEDKLGFQVVHFNSVSDVGLSTKEKLQEFLQTADAAILLMTGEDVTANGELLARQNVVHEVGLFQGRLGFEKAAVLLEDDCAEFSNVTGIGQVRFPKGRVSAAFEDIRDWLSREKLLRT